MKCGPGERRSGPIKTDFAPTTVTGSWVANTTYTALEARDGEIAKYQVKVAVSGAPTSTVLLVNLPSGRVIKTSSLISPVQFGQKLGGGIARDEGAANYPVEVTYETSTSVRVTAGNASTTYLNTNSVNETTPITFGNTDYVEIDFEVPIAGWSSSALMSDEADTRVEAIKVNRATAQSIPNNTTTTIIFNNVVKQTHGSFNATTGVYTVNSAGWFEVAANIEFTGSASGARQLNVLLTGTGALGGGALTYTPNSSASGNFMNGATKVFVPTGGTISFSVFQSSGGALNIIGSGSSYNHASISKISGPSQIMASEKVFAHYQTNAANNISATTIVDFEDKIHDSHNAVTTGASWRFTAPKTCNFIINSTIITASVAWTGGQVLYVDLFKNGSAFQNFSYNNAFSSSTYFFQAKGSATIKLNQGDYIDIRASTDRGATALYNNAIYNFITIASQD